MKKMYTFFIFIGLINLNAQVTKGTYIGFGGGSHYEVTSDDETILIEPCQNFESPLTVANNSYEFKKLSNTDKFGWKGYSDVIFNFDKANNTITFKEPMDMNVQRSYKWMHTPNKLPANGVKTYRDETMGGYSKARVLVTDSNDIKTGKCFIHSVAKSDLNSYLVGNYNGLFDENWQATFNADYSGNFLGLPMTWTLVSDENGNVIKWDIPNSTSVLFMVMVEFEGKLPINMDPVAAGVKVAGIYSAYYDGNKNSIEINQMVK